MNRKQLIAIGLVTVLLVSAVIGYMAIKRNGSVEDVGAQSVEVTEVRRGSIVRKLKVVGTLIADQSVDLHPEIRGTIKAIHFKEGTPVSVGTVLIELEDATYKAKVKEAAGHLKYTQVEYERQVTLAEKKFGKGKELDRATGELQQAEAKHETAKIDLEHTQIKAPFDGVVGLRNVSIGMYVTEQTDLLTIVDVDPIKVDFHLPATHIQVISVGQEVKVAIDGFPGQIFKATIASIDAKVDPTDHSIAVRANIPNKRGILKPGLFGRVSIVVGAKDDALLVPETAVMSTADEEYVFKVVEISVEGKLMPTAIKTPVITGLSEAETIEITRGIDAGDKVVTIGQSKIRHGYPLRIVDDIESVEDDDDDGSSDKSDGASDDDA